MSIPAPSAPLAADFQVEAPAFDASSGRASFPYRLGELAFTEVLEFPAGFDPMMARSAAFARLLNLTALVLGVSYFKLLAPFSITAPELPLTDAERRLVLDVYENGLGEFYARNNLRRFGRISVDAPHAPGESIKFTLPDRALLPIGGGKDSLVSAQLLSRAGIEFTPFAVNPKGPIHSSVDTLAKNPLYITRRLDGEMLQLSKLPGYYNGHVPSTAINSMIAALTALLFGYDRIILSNERSASEGNVSFDGRDANHQHSKSLDFEHLIADVLAEATGGSLAYFSLLRPFSEARIASLFARETRFDRVFSSCNRNFRLAGHDGPLWCGECPKCHFVFLILAPVLERERLIGIFGKNLLADPTNERSFRELTGLAGQKPWECVGEILEAAACLWALTERADWQADEVVSALRGGLLAQYGSARLWAARDELMQDSDNHLIPAEVMQKVTTHAL